MRYIGAMQATPDSKKRGLFWLRYLLAVVLLSGIVSAVPIREIRNALETSRPRPLIAALAILLAGRLLVSVRTKTLTDGQDLSLSTLRLFEISCASTFYGLALPGGFSGGIVRWYRLSRPDGRRQLQRHHLPQRPHGGLAVLRRSPWRCDAVADPGAR